MTISIYEPRAMADALKEMMPARQFLKRLFFPTAERYTVEKVDVDIQVGTRRLAPFVNPKSPAKAVDRKGFTTSTFTPPNLAMKRAITVEDIQTRLPGEHAYAGIAPETRAQELLGGDLADLDEMISRREELMCRDALVSSALAIEGDDVDYDITFTRDASLTKGLIDAADRWDQSTADILAKIKSWRRDIIQLTGVEPDTLILSAEAEDAMLDNSGLIAKLNTLRMDLGQIAPEIRDQGASYIGRLAGTNIDIWSYTEWYLSGGTEYPMIPAKTVLMGCSKARTAMRYGAVPVVDEATKAIGLVPGERVPESWVDRDPAVRWLKLSSRPLPVPVQNNCFLTATVLA